MVSFTTPMPAHTQRAHARGAEWHGDRLSFINQVAHKAPGADGIRAVDMNFTGGWNLHWGIPKRDNYKYVLASGHVRRMTRAELRRPLGKWSDGATRWRRNKAGTIRPHTYAEVVAYAQPRGVTVTAELKWIPTAAQARALVAAAKAANHPPFFMAMLRQRRAAPPGICETKCERIVEAGGRFAVIHGRGILGRLNRRLSGRVTSGWTPGPTRVW